MHLKLAFTFAALSFFSIPAEAWAQAGGGDAIRNACREEARRAISGNRGQMPPGRLKELRGEYARECRKKAKT